MGEDHCEEGLMFLIQCNIYHNSTGDRKQLARAIFNEYVDEGAPRRVNINYDVRVDIQARLDDAPIDLLIVAQNEIRQLMNDNAYKRYIKSQPYGDRLQGECAPEMSDNADVNVVEQPRVTPTRCSRLPVAFQWKRKNRKSSSTDNSQRVSATRDTMASTTTLKKRRPIVKFLRRLLRRRSTEESTTSNETAVDTTITSNHDVTIMPCDAKTSCHVIDVQYDRERSPSAHEIHVDQRNLDGSCTSGLTSSKDFTASESEDEHRDYERRSSLSGNFTDSTMSLFHPCHGNGDVSMNKTARSSEYSRRTSRGDDLHAKAMMSALSDLVDIGFELII